ncbi:choline dehydrogenase 2 [Perkinsus olseni]|uniref:Choline dehydrogenase 2 n=1 Tax=Perkinsus olseni TaxID=32597 RepID=A0A7J6RRN4_PEROL|nr:choline dehydrogenase 2 [Perkinsus olseni]
MEAILARRLHPEDSNADEYLIKWANEPYSRVSWHSMEAFLEHDNGAAIRIRKFEERHPREIDKNVDFVAAPPSASAAGVGGDQLMQPSADSPRRKRSGSAGELELHACTSRYHLGDLVCLLQGSTNDASSGPQAALLDELVDRGLIKEEWLQMERLITFREDEGKKQWMVKWKGLQMTHATWEEEYGWSGTGDVIKGVYVQATIITELIDAWYELNDRSRKAKLQCKSERPAKASEQFLKDFIDVQKDKDGSKKYVYRPTEDTLFDFQIEGVQWLLYNWSQRRGSILADEMGLGKTVQSSVLLSAIMKYSGGGGPCLVVAPLNLATLKKYSSLETVDRRCLTSPLRWGWFDRALADVCPDGRQRTSFVLQWAPSLVTVLFHGNAEDRQMMMDYDLSWVDTQTGASVFEKSSVRRRVEYK